MTRSLLHAYRYVRRVEPQLYERTVDFTSSSSGQLRAPIHASRAQLCSFRATVFAEKQATTITTILIPICNGFLWLRCSKIICR